MDEIDPADRFADLVEDGYVFPDYGGACFADVPSTLLSVLSPEFDRRLPASVFSGVDTDVSQVVLVLLDGLGWDQYQRDTEYAPLLDRLDRAGTVSPLTSIYPSETAAAITTLESGLVPARHGLLGWFQYVGEIDAVLQSLPFLTLDGEPAGDLYDVDESVLSDAEAIYPRARDAGIDAHCYQPEKFDPDTPGATDHPYWNVPDALAELRRDLESSVEAGDSPAYRFLYVPEIDAIAHAVGTRHERYEAQVRSITEAVRAELLDRLDPAVAQETLLVVTADHGHVATDPETNVDLRETAVWEYVDDQMPTGSPRNVQFHVDDPEGAATALYEAFGDEVRTFTREEYLERELFGPGTCARFEERAPDLVATHREKGMWWESGQLELVGMHGGLNRAEMFVPFGAGRVADLQD
ncbi:MAG: alkaline phosphatase family protein [Halolamina sp.]